ncbi:MAG: sulfotransferase family 2 domain-containing protein [Verrucomicrobia bacterium]|nr:sulfotransferase family 2 domain-containing protein [Verrucomicrobiota bacterium]
MRTYDSRHPLISIHLPKSGGTTFRKALETWFPHRLHYHYFVEKNRARPTRIRLRRGFLGLRQRHGMCIHGFFNRNRGTGVFDYYPGARQFITIMRDPLQQHLSHYFYLRNKCARGEHYFKGVQVEFKYAGPDDYLDREEAYILRYLPWEMTLENFKRLIDEHFVFVGITEKMQESVDALADRLGKPRVELERRNVTPRDDGASPEAIARFKERHQLEYALYNYALELNR